MDKRDYIITFDESGQPYIAHISWRGVKTMASGRVSKGASRGMQGVGRGVRTVHKYIEKWGEGAKARYFYTQEELKAALQQGRQKASQAVSNARQAVGNAAARGRAALTTASDKVRTTASSVGTKARDLSSRTSSVLQQHGSELLSSIKSGATTVRDKAAERAKAAGTKVPETVKGVVEKAKDVAGYDERERADAAWEEYDKALEAYKADKSKANKRAVDAAFDKATKLNDEYLSTPLGKIDSTAAKFQEEVQGTVGRALEKAESIKEQVKAIDPSIKIMGDTMTLPGGTEIKIPEVFIKEQTIPESYIRELIIEEQKIEEKKIH